MRSRSPKRSREMRRFIPLAQAFLEEHEVCEFPGCAAPSVVVHHSRGRRGPRLLVVAWWKASCHEHNQAAEERTGESLACGWLVRIEGQDGAA